MNIKKLINTIWQTIKTVYLGLTGEAKKVMPVVLQVIENIKNYQDDGTIDVMTKIIPGEADNWLAAQLRTVIPSLLRDLHLVDNCLHLTDINEQIKCGITKLQLSNDNAKDILLHGIASKVLELTSGGKLQWKNVIGLAEFLYQTIFKKTAVAA